MDLDLQWLLIGLPVAFALGWFASRMDLKQLKRARDDSPRAYFKGLNLLLNEQQDKAIDAFIEAVQHDPGSSDLHFALGNLFRRRGEYERAVRVHQHLLQRGDLPQADRERAQHALAQDYMKAGLFDRAEAAFQSLQGTPFETESRLALLGLHERSRDWPAAVQVATLLEQSGTGSFAGRISHYWCEQAQQALDRGDETLAHQALERAQKASPHAARPLLMQAQRLLNRGAAGEALDLCARLQHQNPEAFVLGAGLLVDAAQACGRLDNARSLLQHTLNLHPSLDLLRALARLDGRALGDDPALLNLMATQPSLSAAQELLALPGGPRDDAALALVREAVARGARPLQRWRCAACGFEAQRYFWQCPGCLSWDSYPAHRVEEQ